MKKTIVLILIIAFSLMAILSGCDIAQNDSNEITQPPALPQGETSSQQQGTDEIPQPPALPEE